MIKQVVRDQYDVGYDTDMIIIQQCRVNYLMIFVKRPAAYNQQLR
ncbi:MAG: hypothetical protein PHR06_02195 [Candidatus Cloacimonetes bacterium]|nr:hypothetical protein [Candidatus Cloacimonadota bacterium]